MKVLLRTGDDIPRAGGGTFWGKKEFVTQNPETTKKFIRAIAKGVSDFRDNKAGSVSTLKAHLGIDSDQEAGLIWISCTMHSVHKLPKDSSTSNSGRDHHRLCACPAWPVNKPDLIEATSRPLHRLEPDQPAPRQTWQQHELG